MISVEDTLLMGCAYAKESNFPEALICLRQVMAVYERDSYKEVPARLLSYYGLSLAHHEGRTNEAIVYCTRAIKKDLHHTDFYVNLARVYLKSGRRSEAVRVLDKGLRIDVQDPGILIELRRLGYRRKPVFRFLNRRNPVNKYLGKFMDHFGVRGRQKPPSLIA